MTWARVADGATYRPKHRAERDECAADCPGCETYIPRHRRAVEVTR